METRFIPPTKRRDIAIEPLVAPPRKFSPERVSFLLLTSAFANATFQVSLAPFRRIVVQKDGDTNEMDTESAHPREEEEEQSAAVPAARNELFHLGHPGSVSRVAWPNRPYEFAKAS
jgi:hypothetical protein